MLLTAEPELHQTEGNVFKPHMFDAGSIGQCVKQSLPWESSEWVLHTLRPQSTRVTTFHKEIVECASWPGFLLDV